MTNCPSCGSKDTNQTRIGNQNEYLCNECLTEFNPARGKVYNEFSYSNLCETISKNICSKMSEAQLGSAIKDIIEGYANEPKNVDILIEKLVDIAENLYNDYKMKRRTKYDFGALLEGINRFNEFQALQSPQNDNISNEVPDVNELPDPMSMINPAVDSQAEVGEHTSLEKLKDAIQTVKTAIETLINAEDVERGEVAPGADNTAPIEPVQGIEEEKEGQCGKPLEITTKTFRKMRQKLPQDQIVDSILKLAVDESIANHGCVVIAKIPSIPKQVDYLPYEGYIGKVVNNDGSVDIRGTSDEHGEWNVKVMKDQGLNEGLQDSPVNAPTLGMPDGQDGITNGSDVNPALYQGEGPEHEAEEDQAISDLKKGLEALETAYAEYINAEEKVHGNGKNADLQDNISALKSLNGVDSQTYFEKANELMEQFSSFITYEEDAELVSDENVDKSYDNSIAMSTGEISTDSDVEDPIHLKEEGEMSIKDLFETHGKNTKYLEFVYTTPENPEGILIEVVVLCEYTYSTGEKASIDSQGEPESVSINKAIISSVSDDSAKELIGKDLIDVADSGVLKSAQTEQVVDGSQVAEKLENLIIDSMPEDYDESTGTESGEIADQPGEVQDPVSQDDVDDLQNSRDKKYFITSPGGEKSQNPVNLDQKTVDSLKAIGYSFEPAQSTNESEYTKKLGVPTSDDISTFGINHTFNQDDEVLYENEVYVIKTVDGQNITLRKPSDNQIIEVLAEECEYSNTETQDVIHERFEQGNAQLQDAWAKIEKNINESDDLVKPLRTYDLREKLLCENTSLLDDPELVAPAPITTQHTPAVIDTYEFKGKKVIRLIAENGLKIEIVPAMTTQGPKFFYYLDRKRQRTDAGDQEWNLDSLEKKLSNLTAQGINISDIGQLISKLEGVAHHMKSPAKNDNIPYAGKFNTEMDEAGFEYFEDVESVSYINECIDRVVQEDAETNSNITLPENKEEYAMDLPESLDDENDLPSEHPKTPEDLPNTTNDNEIVEDGAAGVGAAPAGSGGPCPACGGEGEVHTGDCTHAIESGLPRAGFGYAINPFHKKHKKHRHHMDEAGSTWKETRTDFSDLRYISENGITVNVDLVLESETNGENVSGISIKDIKTDTDNQEVISELKSLIGDLLAERLGSFFSVDGIPLTLSEVKSHILEDQSISDAESKADSFYDRIDMDEAKKPSTKTITTSYEIVDADSAAEGDSKERGWDDEEGRNMEGDEDETSVEKAVTFLRDNGTSFASSSQFHPGIWYSTESDQDIHTGETTTFSFHLNGFTDEEQQEIYNLLKQKGISEEAKLGSGKRFAKLKNKLAHEKGITNPGALSASIGRKKYGAKKMNKLAHAEESVQADNSEETGEVELDEGTYLQGGLSTREAPIPFTQDPSNEGVPDYLTDEEKAAAGARMQQTGMPAESGSSMEESASILDQFKKGDVVRLDKTDAEWFIESISTNPEQIKVKSGKKTKIVNPKTMFIEHVEGMDVHRERQFENIEKLKEAFMEMTIEDNKNALNADWNTYLESKEEKVEEKKLPVLEKNDLYSTIKNEELHKKHKSVAMQDLCEKFSNPIEEMEKIWEDAYLSDTNEDINTAYRYIASPYEENESGLACDLEEAWRAMEETAKKTDEQPGENGGGLGPKQIHGFKINL